VKRESVTERDHSRHRHALLHGLGAFVYAGGLGQGVNTQGVNRWGVNKSGCKEKGCEERGWEARGGEERGCEARFCEARGCEQRGVWTQLGFRLLLECWSAFLRALILTPPNSPVRPGGGADGLHHSNVRSS
jgi:hypothetical protein